MKALHLATGVAVFAALVVAAPAAADPPSNDTFAGATAITALPFSDTLDTTQATTDADDNAALACASYGQLDNSVWYSVTPTQRERISIDLSGSQHYSAQFAVMTGNPGGFSVVTCGELLSGLGVGNFTADAGQTYYILAFDAAPEMSGGGGTLQINVSGQPTPPNDRFAEATPIPSLPFSDTLDTTGATTDAIDAEAMTACGLGDPEEANVWYAFTPTSDTAVTIETSGSNYSAVVNVVTGGPGNFNCAAAGASAFQAVAGQTYYFEVYDQWGPGGTLQISVVSHPAPANDTFAGATAITALPFSDTHDTNGATTGTEDVQALNACGWGPPEAAQASVWYAYTPTTSTIVTVDASASDYPVVTSVLTGSPGTFTCTARGDGGSAFLAIPGHTYYLQVFGVWTPGGTLQMNVSGQPGPQATFTVDPKAKVNKKTGAATVTGTFTCANAPDGASLDVSLTQQVGRFLISGSGAGAANPCDGQSHTWTVTVPGSTGKFAGGKASVNASIQAFNGGYSANAQVSRAIQLS